MGVIFLVGLVFVQLVVGRWKVTLALGAVALAATFWLRGQVFVLPVVQSCVPSGGLAALLAAALWAWRRRWAR